MDEYLKYKRLYRTLKRQMGGGVFDNDKVIKMFRKNKMGNEKQELERLKDNIRKEYPEYLKNPERKYQMFNEYFFRRNWKEFESLKGDIPLKYKKGKERKAWTKILKDMSLKKIAKRVKNKDKFERIKVLKKRYQSEVPDFDMATLGKEAMKVGAEFEKSVKKNIMKYVLEREGISTKGMKKKGNRYTVGNKTYLLYPNIKMYTSCYRSKEWSLESTDDIRETEIDFVITDENDKLLYIVEAKSNVRNVSSGYVQIVRKLRCMNRFDDIEFKFNGKDVEIDLSVIKGESDMKGLLRHGYVIAKLGDELIDFNKVAIEAVISQIIFHGMKRRYYSFNTDDFTIISNYPDSDLRGVIDRFIDKKMRRHDIETSYSEVISFNEIYIPSVVLSNFTTGIIVI